MIAESSLLGGSFNFEATMPGRRKKKERPPKAWIIPANPKYYDVESAFEKEEVIDWKQVKITSLMTIKLLKRYNRQKFTFKVLNDQYGIFAVRGPRSVPNSLRCALENDT